MDRKSIQEQRMRGYFIQATKDLLRSEGLRYINVRNIAETAGYSYATMYNYFKDINELIFLCVQDFQIECKDFIDRKIGNIPKGKERIVAIAKAYTDYFVEYPGIFELFFIERMNDMGKKKSTSSLIYHFFDELCAEDWDACQKDLKLKKNHTTLKGQLHSMLIGLMVLYINRMQPQTYNEFISIRNRLLTGILT